MGGRGGAVVGVVGYTGVSYFIVGEDRPAELLPTITTTCRCRSCILLVFLFFFFFLSFFISFFHFFFILVIAYSGTYC